MLVLILADLHNMALKSIETHRYDPTQQSGWAAGLNALTGALGDFDANQQRKKEEAKLEESEELRKKEILMQERKNLGSEFTPDIAADDSDFVRDAKLQAGRDLADEAANLSRMYKNGDMTIDEWQAANRSLQDELGKIQQGDQFAGTVAQLYDDFADDPGKVSGATSPKALAVAKAVKDGDIRVQIVDGKAVYSGSYDTGEKDKDGNPIREDIPPIGIGKEDGFPAIIAKAPSPGAELYQWNVNMNKELRDVEIENGNPNISAFGTNIDDPRVQERLEGKLDEMLQDDQVNVSLAVDHLKMPREEALALYRSGDLRERLKAELKAQTEKQFFSNAKEKESVDHALAIKDQAARRAEEQFNWARLDRKKQEELAASGITKQTWGEKSFQLEVQGWAQTDKTLRTSISSGDLNPIQGLLADKGVTIIDDDTLLLKNGEELDLPTNPNQAYAMISAFLGEPKVVAAYNALMAEKYKDQGPTIQ